MRAKFERPARLEQIGRFREGDLPRNPVPRLCSKDQRETRVDRLPRLEGRVYEADIRIAPDALTRLCKQGIARIERRQKKASMRKACRRLSRAAAHFEHAIAATGCAHS